MSGSAATGGRLGAEGREGAAARATRFVRAHPWPIAVWSAMTVWGVVLYAVVSGRHAEFRTARFDLGNMVQAVWSTAHGRPLEMTDGPTGEQIVRLGAHVDPILAALAPLWLLFPSPLLLVAVQVAAVALGALPLFWLGRRHLASDTAAGLLALAYLLYPWVAWAAVDVFHPVSLAVPLLLFAVWFLDTERLVPFGIVAVLAMATGELMGLVVAGLGIWYALARRRRRAGAVIAAAGTAWTLVALKLVVPAYSRGESVFYGAYEAVGGSPWGVLRTAATDPGAVLSALGEGRDVLYVVLLAAPLGGLFLLSPLLAAVALPQLLANVLADRSHTTDPHAHYVAGILPFLFAALAIGLARLSPPWRVRAAAIVLVLSLASTAAIGPWPRTLFGAEDWDNRDTLNTSAAHVRALERAVALVPDGAPVSATNRVGGHLAARRYAYSAPVLGRAEWVVLDVGDSWVPWEWGGREDPEAIAGLRLRLERSSDWRRVFDEDGVLVFRKDAR